MSNSEEKYIKLYDTEYDLVKILLAREAKIIPMQVSDSGKMDYEYMYMHKAVFR